MYVRERERESWRKINKCNAENRLLKVRDKRKVNE
jgi:hypothetical protein